MNANTKEFQGFEQGNDIIRLLNNFSLCLGKRTGGGEQRGYTEVLGGSCYILGHNCFSTSQWQWN